MLWAKRKSGYVYACLLCNYKFSINRCINTIDNDLRKIKRKLNDKVKLLRQLEIDIKQLEHYIILANTDRHKFDNMKNIPMEIKI